MVEDEFGTYETVEDQQAAAAARARLNELTEKTNKARLTPVMTRDALDFFIVNDKGHRVYGVHVDKVREQHARTVRRRPIWLVGTVLLGGFLGVSMRGEDTEWPWWQVDIAVILAFFWIYITMMLIASFLKHSNSDVEKWEREFSYHRRDQYTASFAAPGPAAIPEQQPHGHTHGEGTI